VPIQERDGDAVISARVQFGLKLVRVARALVRVVAAALRVLRLLPAHLWRIHRQASSRKTEQTP
jgi:hypothetical protein